MHDIADVWERLGDEVSEAKGLGSVLLVGDLNAHTAGLPDFPAADAAAPDAAQGAEGAATCSVRRSEDAARPANSHGRQLLALCQQSGLRILNGRVCGDSAGALTYLGHNGSGSLVAYALACPVSFHMVQSMRVVPQVDSDHSALHLTVALPQLERRAAAPRSGATRTPPCAAGEGRKLGGVTGVAAQCGAAGQHRRDGGFGGRGRTGCHGCQVC